MSAADSDTRRRVVQCSCLLIWSAGTLCAQLQERAAPTLLRIQPLDERGSPVRLSRAELYVDWWGHGQNISIPRTERGIELRLDRSWLCDQWPDGCKDEQLKARLILEADGYAPVVSKAFVWLGAWVDFQFPRSAAIRIREAESKETVVQLRRKGRRVLRLLDENGHHLPGVVVQASAFFASSNHCGAIEGDRLHRGATNSAGEIVVPDADAEYAFEFNKPHYALLKPASDAYPMQLVTELTAPVTTVVLRERERRPLRMEITGNRPESANLFVMACMAACPCGACCGSLGVLDARGRLQVEAFYPEEYDRLELRDESETVYWKGSPKDVPRSGWLNVQLR